MNMWRVSVRAGFRRELFRKRKPCLGRRNPAVLLAGFLLLLSFMSACAASEQETVFDADVVLEGGSGKAWIESPCTVERIDGTLIAELVWSSPNYDYMVVDGQTYLPVSESGNSVFRIPVELDAPIPVQADTTAMGTPHLIDYILTLTRSAGTERQEAEQELSAGGADLSHPDLAGHRFLLTEENRYAVRFAIHRYSEGYTVICTDDGRKYLVVPEGGSVPDYAAAEMTVIRRPAERIYLAASAAMSQFVALDAVDRICLSGVKEDGWAIPEARTAMAEGRIRYGGKYSAPDYERILDSGTDLSVESTMILHAPKVLEKLEQLGIPVLIDRSSYEPEPLGRTEWIRVYGTILGEEDAAEKAFSRQSEQAEAVGRLAGTGKTAAVFALNTHHQIVTRSAGDYFAEMIRMAGGTYAAPSGSMEGGSGSSVTISLEEFCRIASDADILIWNATITQVPETVEALAAMEPVFRTFRAVQNGTVYFTDASLYQRPDAIGSIVSDLHTLLSEGYDTDFFHPVPLEAKKAA